MDDFDRRFDELASVAYRVAYRLLGEREESRDIAQEALTRAYVRWRRVHPYADAWVARVAANLALGRLRRRRPEPVGIDPVAAARAADRADDVAARLELQQALAGLPRRQRDVVVLRYLADLPEAVVAELLGCAPGTVKSHAHRGLDALRRQLGDGAVRLAGGTA